MVVRLRALVDARHLDVEVERADVVAERDEVVADVLLELGQLRLDPPASPPAREQQQAAAEREQRQQHRGADAAAALRGTGVAARAQLADPVDEVQQHGADAVAAVLAERLGRLLSRPVEIGAAGLEVVAGDDRVDPGPPEQLLDPLRDPARGAAARAQRRRRQDRDVHRARVTFLDPLADPIRVGLGDRALRVRVGVDRVGAQRLGGLGDDVLRRGRRREQRRQHQGGDQRARQHG